MNSRRIVVLVTAVLLAVVPASTAFAHAAHAGYGSRALATPTPEPPEREPVTDIFEPVDFGENHCAEADGTAAPDEVEAVINVPRLVTVGTTVPVVMDQSRGFIALWLLCVENPDGTPIYSVGGFGLPRDAHELNVAETGTYRLTLTVVDFWAHTHTVTRSVIVWQPIATTGP